MKAPDPTKFLTRGEIKQVLAHLKREGFKKFPTRRQNLIIFRLACCCGLRVSEIAGLRLVEMTLTGERPAMKVRGKGNKKRTVPLWWDQGTLDDLRRWKEELLEQGEPLTGYVVAAQIGGRQRTRLNRRDIRNRWRTAIGVLGKERVAQLSIHAGRHSFISHSLNAGRSLAEVRDAAGHSNVEVTNIYVHAMAGELGDLPDVFGLAG